MSTRLIGPDGEAWVLDNEDPAALDEALRQGYTIPVAPDEPTTLTGQALKAGSELADVAGLATFSAVEGLTGGMPGVAIGLAAKKDPYGTMADVRRLIQGSREAHPIAAGIGELAGSVASPVMAAGTAAASGIGTATALSRIGRSAVAGGVSNMLFGAGKTLSDAALGDTDLAAEQLIANAGLGAVLGAAGGGLGAALGEGISAGLGKAAGAKESLLKLRDAFGLKAAGAMAKEFKEAAYRDNGRDIVELLIKRGIMKAGDKVDDVAGKAEKLAGATDDAKRALEQALQDKGVVVSGPAVAKEIEQLAAGYAGGNVGDKAIAARLMEEAKAVRFYGKVGPKHGSIPFREAEELKRGFDKYLEWGAEQGPLQQALKKVRGIFNAANEAAAAKSGAPEVAEWLTTKKELGLLSQVADFSRARAEALKANRFISLTDYMSGGAGGVAGAAFAGDENRLEGALMGASLGLGNKLMRERMPAIIAKMADAIAKSPALSTVAKSFAPQVPALSGRMGQYGALLTRAAQLGPNNVLATHIAHAQADERYAATAELAGLSPETQAEEDAAMSRASGMVAVGDSLGEQSRRIDEAIEAIMSGAQPAQKPRKTASDKQHLETVDELRRLSSDPEALVELVARNTAGLGGVAPAVTASLAARAHAAVQHLAGETAGPIKAGPLAREWAMTDARRHTFEAKLEAIQDPMSVLSKAASGRLTRQQRDAFAAVYPKLSRQVADIALMRLAEAPKGVPYASRLALSRLTGIDVDGTSGRLAIARNQAAIRATSQRQQSAAPGARNTTMTLAQRTATPSQRRELEVP